MDNGQNRLKGGSSYFITNFGDTVHCSWKEETIGQIASTVREKAEMNLKTQLALL